MPDLVAQGPGPNDQWRRALPAKAVTLGRSSDVCDWAADWDDSISRFHATLSWNEGKLHVTRNPKARNPLFHDGKKVEECLIGPGEFFFIGKTRFVLDEPNLATPAELPSPVSELTCSAEELEEVRFKDAGDRIEVLARLPNMIRYSPTDQECERQVTSILLAGIPEATIAAIVQLDPQNPGGPIRVRTVLGRVGEALSFQPSKRLVLEAMQRRRQPVLHRWEGGGGAEFTAAADTTWALCAPLSEEPEPGWALYLVGNATRGLVAPGTDADEARRSDLKFAGVVADIFGALKQMRFLQKRKSLLESFLSPTVLAAIAYEDMDEVLQPRQTDVTVLFCDLRGFSRMVEVEQLQDICDRVSEALCVMTRNILLQDGVISDFQGDAAMGFWGWPLSGPGDVEKAARAAVAIRKELQRFGKRHQSELACGIGLAHGPAIAGRLGTPDQFKIGVFGPVVNLASRLESLTKYFKVAMLIDEQAAKQLAEVPNKFRLRRLARIQPYGVARKTMLYELMLPKHEAGAMSDTNQRDYEAALDHFMAGRWVDARTILEPLAADGPSRILLDFMNQNRRPPNDWDGSIAMTGK